MYFIIKTETNTKKKMKTKSCLFVLLLMMLGLCACNNEKEEDLWNGDLTGGELTFNKDGEPVMKNVTSIKESTFEKYIMGKLAYLDRFIIVGGDGLKIEDPVLYGISNPLLYFKDKEHIIIFNEEDGTVKQYYQIKGGFDFGEETIFRSEGKYVGQFYYLRPGIISTILYYGEQNGKPVYVYVKVVLLTDDVPATLGLDWL